MHLSIVTTLYQSEKTIEEFIDRASAAALELTEDFEIILVDDGSPDESLSIAVGIALRNQRIKVIELSRNFGHHKALMTGLAHAKGDYCFLIDSDLEEDPALLPKFAAELHARDVDVVFGVQGKRKGRWVERVAGELAYRVFDSLMSISIPRNHTTVRLARRHYVDALLQHRESEIILGGLYVITGFKQFGMTIAKGSRASTTYNLWRRWKLLLQSVTSFSEVPLVAIFYLGLMVSSLSVIVALFLLYRKLAFNVTVAGWVSVMLSVWFLGGLLIFCVGIIGIYISTIFLETKGRPTTIVRAVHARGAGSPRTRKRKPTKEVARNDREEQSP